MMQLSSRCHRLNGAPNASSAACRSSKRLEVVSFQNEKASQKADQRGPREQNAAAPALGEQARRSKVIFEPFRIKSVEPLKVTTQDERKAILAAASYNLFKVQGEDVMIDFLTDSGTGAMSSEQWAGIMRGDESYAGAKSWFRFRDVVADLTGFQHIVPAHQGRAAERILFSSLQVKGRTVLANTFFDTTRANAESQGACAIDLPIPESRNTSADIPFKGNMDIERLGQMLEERDVACVVMTVTNNSGGGQPVSMANIKAAAALCKVAGVPFYLDACRFAENAYFIKQDELGYEDTSIKAIAQEMFSLCDGATFSAKKDGLANIGGFLITRDAAVAEANEQQLILTEGFPTYGGLAGRDLDAIAVGLQEVVQEDYLEYRIASTRYLGAGLLAAGIPIVRPAGGHAVYIDAGAFLPHIPATQFPGHAVACAFYAQGGIRSCEIGTLMFGGADPGTGKERVAALELCRMAIPRRVYTQSHVEYVLEVAKEVAGYKDSLQGFNIVQAPQFLRHFSAQLQPVQDIGHFYSPRSAPQAQAGDGRQGKHAAQLAETDDMERPIFDA